MRVIKRLILIITVLALAFSLIPHSLGDTISGQAEVGNSMPRLVGVDVSGSMVDPESSFTVRTEISDNNTLGDIDNVILKVYENTFAHTDSDDKRNHYTFWFDPSDNTWHSGVGANIIGDPFIDSTNSTYPTDLGVNQDNYNFVIRLNGTASPSNWNVYAEVIDSQSDTDDLEKGNEFSVNNYVSYSIGIDTICWSDLEPDSNTNPSDNNPVQVDDIETNVRFDVQNKLDNDWACGADTIDIGNTMYASSDGSGESGFASMAFSNIFENQNYGENLSRGINYYLDVPSDCSPGTYTNTFIIEVSET